MELKLNRQPSINIQIDPESPTTKEAIGRLGIDPNELLKKHKNEFALDCENAKVLDFRYKNYLTRYHTLLKKLEDEKQAIRLRGNNGSVMSRLNSRYNVSLPLMSSNSVRNLRRLDESSISRGGLGVALSNQRYSVLSNIPNQSSLALSLPRIGKNIETSAQSPSVLSSGRGDKSNKSTVFSSDIYAKISQEYEKMTESKVKSQIDLKNHLLQQLKNEQYMQKLEQKLKRIEEYEKEELEEIQYKKQMREQARKNKLQRVKSEMERNVEESELMAQKYNEERLKRVKEQKERQLQIAQQEKEKFDKELEIKQNIQRKKHELEKQEEEQCLNRLKELDQKINQKNNTFLQRQQEKQSHLKSQSLIVQMKNDMARKQFEEQKEKKQERVIKKIQQTEKQINQRLEERDEMIKYRTHQEEQKGDRAYQNHLEAMRQDQEYRRMTEDKINRKIARARLGNSMTAPKLLSDLVMNNGHSQYEVADDIMLKYESKKLKEHNFQENYRREQKKQQLKKQQILEKEYAYSQKVQLAKIERQMIEKCKVQTQNAAIKSKEDKNQFIQRLKAYSVIDKNQKKKAQKIALQLATDIDLGEVFADKKKDENGLGGNV
ncbi:UNKNOWN [Stylonychia lemnae]|uniref:Uncharacterized protein n=1 Tax=Stylonychia lemnae TaxID=5949 RepID=A0A078AZS9_STYLE|nr:UNKNOWN [Stylonychia lemnae]|eukprot:CDW86303.1 UNKNOWN [Stylonychia lemnae]